MDNIGDSNYNNEDGRSESSDDDEETSTIDETETIVEESTHSSQPATDVVDDGTDRMIDQLTVREFNSNTTSRHSIIPSRYCGIKIIFYWYWFMSILMSLTIGHSLYWFIFVLIGFSIYCIDAILYPVWTYDNQFRIQLGNTQPWPLDYNPVLNQGLQEADRITHPSDEGEPLVITFTLSSTVEIYVYHQPPRESTGVQDTQPHDMPIPLILHNNRHELITDDENNRAHVAANAHENSGANADLMIHNGPDIQTIIENNTMTGAPTERPHDTDFSIATIDLHAGNRSDAARNKDEQRLLLETSPIITRDNYLTQTSEGQASSNTQITTDGAQNNIPSNQANATDGQSGATGLTIDADSSSPQIPQTKRDVGAPTEGGPERILPNTNPTIINVVKVSTPGNSTDQLSGKTGV